MSSTLEVSGFTQASFDAFIESRNEPGWLIDLRRQAWKSFLEKDLPARTEEEWMRTDIRLFKLDRFGIPTASDQAECSRPLLLEGVEVAGSNKSANGVSVDTSFADSVASQGVLFGDLSQLANQHEALIQKHLFTRAVNPHFDKFSALHAACWTTGTLLYVPDGVTVELPFHSLASLSGGTDLSHLLVIMGENSEATFLNETGSLHENDGGLHCGASEIFVGKGARLRFVTLQDWGRDVWHFAHQRAIVDRDASLQWTVGALGSRLSKANQEVELVGPGAECQVNGVMFTEGKQHLSYHTQQHHAAPHCRSDFLYKAALQDKSRTVWRGIIKVDPGAQKTDGYQRNDNLLLSGNARADAIPGLAIEADDVRCTHGSTTARVDDELVFYAQTRGLTKREAVRIAVTGFFSKCWTALPLTVSEKHLVKPSVAGFANVNNSHLVEFAMDTGCFSLRKETIRE
ncbi:MAG: Fe-S cluster assembly protein SufD [Pirellulaceae bacterium]